MDDQDHYLGHPDDAHLQDQGQGQDPDLGHLPDVHIQDLLLVHQNQEVQQDRRTEVLPKVSFLIKLRPNI